MEDNHKLKLQLGRRAAYLRRCITVIDLLSEYESTTTVRLRVFNEYIRPVMHVSYATFNNMLNENNPLKQLEQIEEELSTL